MAAARAGRVLLFTLTIVLTNADFAIPDVKIQAFADKGFRASIPDATNQALFAFQGVVNKKIATNQVGTLAGEVISKSSDGRWNVDVRNVTLKVGDVIDYHVFVSVDRTGYVKDNQQFTITELEPYVSLGPEPEQPATTTTTPAPAPCAPSLTKLRTGRACAGQVVFEETFDTLRESVWQVEQYIPVDHPELPFVSYQKSAVTVKDGHLRITAGLQQTQPGFTNDSITEGTLNLLQGCTSNAQFACQTHAQDAMILPPVVSGRIISRPGFAFTYGTVTVRAKLPKGDWLYPEILLEPFLKKFGSGPLNFKSGVVKVACAAGNREIQGSNGRHIGNRNLYVGPITSSKCWEAMLSRRDDYTYWGDDFHVYSVRWTPDAISFSVDGNNWFTVKPTPHSRATKPAWLEEYCSPGQQPGMAPFDDHFYLTLGLAAGGVTDFPDDLILVDGKKPWVNTQYKATLNFWNSLDKWHASWENPELLVDYIKVEAL